MNIFDEILHRLSSKTRTRALFNDVHIEDMEKIIRRMQKIVEEKKQARVIDQKERKARQSMIRNIQNTLKENGLSLDDLNERHVESDKRASRKMHTYEYITLSGDSVFWYGSAAGRLPKPFQQYLNRTGKKRVDCIVSEND
ncbi:H-NS family nucleoid-associated regulatory protein [Candidatus Sororendozoicomonas aggregata]|uniref:H-NS family histone-like protein n=1 Tax=Candidatus Sororendozoicomonas aggregata TaxID=3073239 RepID=UPI002ED679DA